MAGVPETSSIGKRRRPEECSYALKLELCKFKFACSHSMGNFLHAFYSAMWQIWMAGCALISTPKYADNRQWQAVHTNSKRQKSHTV